MSDERPAVDAQGKDSVGHDLRRYYEEEAAKGLRTALQGPRVELRDEFIELMRKEDRRSVVDFGAGPGFDGGGFIEADRSYVGVDLAHGNGVLAAAMGVTVLQGSVTAPPLRPRSFDAGWSMSTIMHLPEAEVHDALVAMAQCLTIGAPFLIALWGSVPGKPPMDEISPGKGDLVGQRRLFSLRSFERNRELISAVGPIENEKLWDVQIGDHIYQQFLVRVTARPA